MMDSTSNTGKASLINGTTPATEDFEAKGYFANDDVSIGGKEHSEAPVGHTSSMSKPKEDV
jgi:hypothetical protein